ncbi:hypothetical protein [Anianabacter salinae]|nr:hypothetical protein [Anianabacter salinae]MBV0910960.1 hypothetical protein [Anianabacter salinae]
MIRRLFTTIILCGIAYVAGMMAERGNQKDLCEASGGVWMRAGFCAQG